MHLISASGVVLFAKQQTLFTSISSIDSIKIVVIVFLVFTSYLLLYSSYRDSSTPPLVKLLRPQKTDENKKTLFSITSFSKSYIRLPCA